jgi:hypothetical protein
MGFIVKPAGDLVNPQYDEYAILLAEFGLPEREQIRVPQSDGSIKLEARQTQFPTRADAERFSAMITERAGGVWHVLEVVAWSEQGSGCPFVHGCGTRCMRDAGHDPYCYCPQCHAAWNPFGPN